jgi:hypothetical protein
MSKHSYEYLTNSLCDPCLPSVSSIEAELIVSAGKLSMLIGYGIVLVKSFIFSSGGQTKPGRASRTLC